MTNNSGNNTHVGLIRSITPSEIEIGVEAPVACSSCEVASSCGLADREEKIIIVKTDDQHHFIGEKVTLAYKEELSTKALLIVYIFPVIVIVFVLYIAQLFTENELIIGFSALLSLIPYFLLFNVFSKRIDKVFSFSIAHFDEHMQTELNT